MATLDPTHRSQGQGLPCERCVLDDSSTDVSVVCASSGSASSMDGPQSASDEDDSTTEVQCPICFDAVRESDAVRLFCGERHPFCADCLRQHIASVPFPRCPAIGCSYELEEADVVAVCGEGEEMEAFRCARLQRAVARLHGKVACPNPACANVVVCDPECRTRVVCSCGWEAFCSRCRQPYHYHTDCGAVQPLRSQWCRWLTVDRAEYHEHIEGYNEVCERRRQVVQEAVGRHRELEADEEWKAKSCRLCPKCFRTIEKVAGCNSMVCGRNYHGGNDQKGCGHSFDWSHAPPYQPRVERMQELPEMDAAAARLRGASVRHFFTSCSLCLSSIRGPRLQCIHCETYDCCLDCEPRLAELHPPDHVFQILLEPTNPINEDLPVGTEVEVFGLDGAAAALNGASANLLRYLPDARCYELDLPMGGAPLVPAANVQPAGVDSAAAAQDVLERSLAQKDARRFTLDLGSGARVQLGAVGGKPELQNLLASVVRYFPAGEFDYSVQLEKPIDWVCQACTLVNAPQVQTCSACRRPRGAGVSSGTILVCASEISPIISEANQAKGLAQRHWAEQQRLEKVVQANSYASLGSLDLPGDQLVQLHADQLVKLHAKDARGCDEVKDADGSFATVLAFDAWSLEYRVRLEDINISAGSLERKWPVSACKPCFWLSQNPLAAVEDSESRHAVAVARLKDVQGAQSWMRGTYLGLKEGQMVLVPSADSEADRLGLVVRGVVSAYKPEQGVYSVRLYDGGKWCLVHCPRERRDIECHLVEPVLWGSEAPYAEAERMVARHADERSRLCQAEDMAISHAGCNLDIPSGTWVKVSQDNTDDLIVRVESFDSWRCAYAVEEFLGDRRIKKHVDAVRVRPEFRSSPDPASAAAEVNIRHAAEKLRRQLVAEANAQAKDAVLNLPVGQLVEISGIGQDTRFQIHEYNPADTSYAVRAWGMNLKFSEIKHVVSSKDVCPVFWHSSDPEKRARSIQERDVAERNRLEKCTVAEVQAQTCFLGLPRDSLVYVEDAKDSSKDRSRFLLWTVHDYLPEASAYTVHKYGKKHAASVCSSDSFSRTVPWESVEPCFSDANDPFARAVEREVQHSAEVTRLDAVEAANAASVRGCFLAMAFGQCVELQGEGVWRRPSLDHSGRGTVIRYIPENRAYDICLENLDGSCAGSDFTLNLVKACHIKATFWHSTNPSDELRTLLHAHEAECKRLSIARVAADRCQHAHLNLPTDMLVAVDVGPQYGSKVHGANLAVVLAYHPSTQTYQLQQSNTRSRGSNSRSSQSRGSFANIPAMSVRPHVWSDESPASVADRAVEAHDIEEQRLQEVEVATAELAGCVSGFPKGLPVRLLRAVQVQGSPERLSPFGPSRDSWGAWFKRYTGTSSSVPGGAAGDVAVICRDNGNGTYDLKLLADAGSQLACCNPGIEPGTVAIDSLPSQAVVTSLPVASFQPLLVLAQAPRSASERLWQLHAEACNRREALETVLPRASSLVPLALCRGTEVEVARHGRCVVVSYNAAVPGYFLKKISVPMAGFVCPASDVRVALDESADPVAALEAFKTQSQKEAQRLAQVRQANARAASWHEGLPCGTHVSLDKAVRLPIGNFLHVGRVTRHSADGYFVQVESAANALSVSSESVLEVRAARVVPTFYHSEEPLVDAEVLYQLLRAADDQ